MTLFWVARVCAGDLPRANPEEVGFSAERLAFVDRFYSDKVTQGEMAGIVLLVARHGKVAHFSAIGYADVGRKKKMAPDTIFRLYSMTKPVAATALMLLYEEGKFRLDDPISKYIPEFSGIKVLRTPESPLTDTVPAVREPTIHDLLRHTAGFTHGGHPERNAVDAAFIKADLLKVDLSLTEMMRRLAKIPLLHQPGTRYEYGISPDVQARLIEILSGLPYDEFLEKRLFGPLDMKDSGFSVQPEEVGRLAAIHWSKDGKLIPADDAHGYFKATHPILEAVNIHSYTGNHPYKGGSVGLVSTAEDYWRFAQMMLNGGQLNSTRILSPQVVRYMARDHLPPGAMLAVEGKPTGFGFGLGFAVVKDPAALGYMSSEGSFYWSGVAATHFWIDPKEDLVVVAMSQHLHAPGAAPLLAEIHTLVYSALVN